MKVSERMRGCGDDGLISLVAKLAAKHAGRKRVEEVDLDFARRFEEVLMGWAKRLEDHGSP
jgi:hypothetical protein